MSRNALTNLTTNNNSQQRKRLLACDSENIPPFKNIKSSSSLEGVVTSSSELSKEQLLSSNDNKLQNEAVNISSAEVLFEHDCEELNHSCPVSDTIVPVSKELKDKNSFSLSSTPAMSEDGFYLNAFCGDSSLLQTCYICENSFEGRQPLLLGCLHVYCSPCILQQQNFLRSSLIAKKRSQNSKSDTFVKLGDMNTIPDTAFRSLESLHEYNITNLKNRRLGSLMVRCHICQTYTKAKFIRRYAFSNLKKQQDSINSDVPSFALTNEKLCTNCEENSMAIGFCRECDELLCKRCVNAHKRLKITKEHVLQFLKIDERKNESDDSLLLYCTTHSKEEIKLFCETCKALTCRDCQLEFHRDHKYLFVAEAANNQTNTLKKIKKKLTEKRLSLERTSLSIESQFGKILKSRDRAIQNIVAYFQQLRERLEDQCRSLVELASDKARKSRIQLSDQFYEVGQLLCAVDYSLNFIDFASEKQNNLPLLDAREMIVDYTRKVQLQRFADTPVVTSNIVFVPRKDVEKLFEKDLGSVEWKKSNKEDSTFTSRTETESTPTRGVRNFSCATVEPLHTDNLPDLDVASLNFTPTAKESSLSSLKKCDLAIADIHSVKSATAPVSTSTPDVIEISVESPPQVFDNIKVATNPSYDFCDLYDLSVDQLMPYIVPHHQVADQKPDQSCLNEIVQLQSFVEPSNSPQDEKGTKTSSVSNETLVSTASAIDSTEESLTPFVPLVAERLTTARPLNSPDYTNPLRDVIGMDSSMAEHFTVPSVEDPHKSSSREENSTSTSCVVKRSRCAVCNAGGGLLRCDTCLRVFHNNCHVPKVIFVPRTVQWQCMLCVDVNELLKHELVYPGRSCSSGMQERELKICEKLTLELCCHPQYPLFHVLVCMSVVNSSDSFDLTNVREKLSSAHPIRFTTVEAFLSHIFSLFTTCFQVKGENSAMSEMAKGLQAFFIVQVKKGLPEMFSFVDDLVKTQRKQLDGS